MQGMIEAIRSIFVPPNAAIESLHTNEARLHRSAANMQTMRKQLSETTRDLVVLNDTIEHGDTSTKVSVHTDRIIIDGDQCVKLTDTMKDYQALQIEMRLELGRKIAGLFPDLAHSKHELLLNHTAKVLSQIAKDQDERVRMMLADELAELPEAPYEVVKQLAYDSSPRVACQILEYSTLLGDQELIEILSTSCVAGVPESIAKRNTVSEALSGAIVATQEPEAIGLLLENKGASIGNEAMNEIIELAPEHEGWHKSLVSRPEITRKTMARISGFVSQDILMQLEDSGQIKKRHKRDGRTAVQHRLNSWSEEQLREAELRVRELHKMGRLDDELIDTAINTPNEALVIAALTARSNFRREKVQKILRSESPRAITSLAWEAGLPMRSAYALQLKIGRVHHTKLIHARGGTDYPLPEDEMQTYLDLFS